MHCKNHNCRTALNGRTVVFQKIDEMNSAETYHYNTVNNVCVLHFESYKLLITSTYGNWVSEPGKALHCKAMQDNHEQASFNKVNLQQGTDSYRQGISMAEGSFIFNQSVSTNSQEQILVQLKFFVEFTIQRIISAFITRLYTNWSQYDRNNKHAKAKHTFNNGKLVGNHSIQTDSRDNGVDASLK